MKDYSEEWKQVFSLLEKIAGSPEPRKPREWNVIVNAEGNINLGFKYDPRFYGGVRVREVIE